MIRRPTGRVAGVTSTTRPRRSRAAPPDVTAEETVDAILAQANRDHLPLRLGFLQRTVDGVKQPGPLAEFVRTSDRRALVQFLLAVRKASTHPWDATLPAPVWARALGIELPGSKAACSSVSKAWHRIESRGLITRGRVHRLASVTLLREDGSGDEYTHPADDEHPRYFKVPDAFWLTGPATAMEHRQRWYQVLAIPELACLLVALSSADGFRMPFESTPAWYGISADSALRGVHRLIEHGVLTQRQLFKKAPLSPQGYTAELHYTLAAPFGPKGTLSAAAKGAVP
jgi:hypothetical protein